MELVANVAMLLTSMWFLCSLTSASPQGNARALDSLLQDYAYRAFVRPKTGLVYDGVVPSNLTGIRVSAMRLRSGSLRKRQGNAYKEFVIPKGLLVHPYVERLVLVYQNLGNWSTTYYPLHGYTYLTPVIGLLAYDASNLTARNLPELDLFALSDPISIKFPGLRMRPFDGYGPKCVSFYSNGSIDFSDVSPANNSCTTFRQGHFSLAVESGPRTSGEKGKGKKKKVWIVASSVVGGSVLLLLLGTLLVWALKCARRKKMYRMEKASEAGEALHLTTVGIMKAPVASGTRTQPSIETEYVP